MIKDPFKVNLGIDLFMRKVEEAPVSVFRDLVWEVFCQTLEQTPQWSGKAVANWNLSVGSPDFSWDDDVGDKVDLWATNTRQRGDNEWIEYAKFRNHDQLAKIKRREKVFITNAVHGDDDSGKANSEMYLDALQDPGYWVEKLRAVNKPYEVATETVIRVMREFKLGRRKGVGLAITQLGGDSIGRYA